MSIVKHVYRCKNDINNVQHYIHPSTNADLLEQQREWKQLNIEMSTELACLL